MLGCVYRVYLGVHLCASLPGQWEMCPAASLSAGSVGPCGSVSKEEAGVLVRPSIREHQDCHSLSGGHSYTEQYRLFKEEIHHIHSPKGLLGTPVQFLINAII